MAVIYNDVKIHIACVSEIQSNFLSIYKDQDNLFLLRKNRCLQSDNSQASIGSFSNRQEDTDRTRTIHWTPHRPG